jgi:ABC-type nickel/cobalt efflux system permease component RcnA
VAALLLILLVAVWLFVRTWWGHLPHKVAQAVIR